MRVFACACLVTILGIVNLSQLPPTWFCVVFLVLSLLLGLRFRGSRVFVSGMLVAMSVTFLALYSLASHQLLEHQVSADLDITVLIDSIPERQERRLSFIAELVSCHSCSSPLNVERIRLSWYGRSPDLLAGESWRFTVRLKPPMSLRNPGGFDAVAWSLVKGIHAKGYVREATHAARVSQVRATTLSAVRHNVSQKIQQLSALLSTSTPKPINVPGSPQSLVQSIVQSASHSSEYLGLVQALSVGFKSGISDQQWELLRTTGTAHLVAISGLHVGLVAAWVLLGGKLLLGGARRIALVTSSARPLPDLRICLLISSLLLASLYALLAGFELPTQRAVLMLSVWILAALRLRFLPPMAALCIALAVILSTNVLNPLSAGFWLSFGTVATLIYLHRGHVRAPIVSSRGSLKSRFIQLRHTARTHCLLGIVLLPVGAWFFQSGSLLAPLANLIAVPWVAMVSVPLALMTLVASSVSDSVALPLLALTTLSLHCLMLFLKWLDATQLSSIVLVLPGITAFLLSIAGLVVVFGPRGLKLRAMALPLFLPAVLFNIAAPANDRFDVHFLDVGQGLAVLIFAGDETLLFDTGGKVSPQLSMFEAVVVPFLHASGRKHIDTLVVSHGDEDHAFGVPDVLARYPEISVYTSQNLPSFNNKPVKSCQSGISWEVESVNFGFLHPNFATRGGDNNRSCVLLAHSGKSRVLLTGDIETAAEAQLLSNFGANERFPVTIMSAPHHGSKTSSTQDFVDRMRPEYVVFSAGARNRFGFPHSDVKLRYNLSGSRVFVTGTDGAVSFSLGPEGLTYPPLTWWHSHRRFWHGIVNPDCWQQFADQSLVLRLLALSQKGIKLCGK